MESNLRVKIESLPPTAGIYKFLNEKGEILYIGKAANLKSRVSSYFREELFDRPRIRQMMPLVSDIEIQETNNEIEALVLESALVKEMQPPFNSDLKDGKSYAWIYISTREKFPTVKIVRSIKKGEYKRGRMFGPYPSGYTVKRVFSYLRKIYPFCICKNKDCESSLDYHIGLCPGPYAGKISQEEYRENINNIIKFLNGKQGNHIRRLEKEMKQYSMREDFEKAAELRDRIRDLRYIGQSIDFTYYDDSKSYKSKREKARESSFGTLQYELGLKRLKRIECYDISNMQGKHAYGSMVVANKGKLERGDYRIFRIKGKDTPDDPGMLKEVLERRFKTVHEDTDSSLSKFPEIVLIDGGKSQLSTVKDSVPSKILLLGISKGKHIKRKGGLKRDEFWVVKGDEIYQVDLSSTEILIDLRNEAHRFAISHYRRRSIKESKKSALDNIPGVGNVRRKALIKNFKSMEGIKGATVEQINEVLKNKNLSNLVKKSLN